MRYIHGLDKRPDSLYYFLLAYHLFKFCWTISLSPYVALSHDTLVFYLFIKIVVLKNDCIHRERYGVFLQPFLFAGSDNFIILRQNPLYGKFCTVIIKSA